MDQLNFRIPGKPEYLTMIRLAVGSVATTAGFDFDAVEDIKTAVAEACKNVSCHGFDGFSDEYELICNIDKGLIEISITDKCDCHTLKKISKPCMKCPQEGNMGVYVIETLVDDVEFNRSEDGRKSIRMIKRV